MRKSITKEIEKKKDKEIAKVKKELEPLLEYPKKEKIAEVKKYFNDIK